MWSSKVRLAALACAILGLASTASTQSNDRGADAVIDGPAPPVPPDIVARDTEGRVTLRATRVAEPIVLDGHLDETVYAQVPSIGDFVQQEPTEGEAATEKTDVWLLFDDRNIYVSVRCWDSHPEREVSNEMRRDARAIFDNELFTVTFDTFYDRRNAFLFAVNPPGGLADSYVTDERDFNLNWNTVWDARTARFDQGWTVEISIPFKSLRYQARQAQVWGINFRRTVRWKNETSHLTRIPAAIGRRGMNKISSAASLVGIEPPTTNRNFEVKPYGIADLTTDRTKDPPTSNDLGRDAGLDVKLGLTKSLTADLSYNTDFAQVEVDEQQVNLTRFNVFFPEKRDFFLEGQGIFTFGGVQNYARDGIGPGGANLPNPNPADMPNLFFSRRVGLTEGHTAPLTGLYKVPIEVGGRVTGKAGPYSIGLLDIRTGKEPRIGVEAANFGVVRIKRDILRRSAIGALITQRSIASSGRGANTLFGVDGVFSFYQNLSINTYLAKTKTDGTAGHDMSYRAQFDYGGDRYGLQLEHMFLDDHFNPDVGFVRRSAFRRNSAFVRFSPRPASITAVRKFTWDATYDHITDTGGRLQSRNAEAAFRSELQNGDSMAFEYARNYEFLAKPFAIAKDVTIPVGGYGFPEVRFMYWFGPQREASGIVRLVRGSFYNGTRTEVSAFRSRIEITPQISIEPGLTVDWVDLPEGKFATTLMSARTTYTLTPRIAVGALMQYVSTTHALGTNIRFRWEFIPGSDFYIVYTDDRDTRHAGFPTLQSRGLVVKLTRLFRM